MITFAFVMHGFCRFRQTTRYLQSQTHDKSLAPYILSVTADYPKSGGSLSRAISRPGDPTDSSRAGIRGPPLVEPPESTLASVDFEARHTSYTRALSQPLLFSKNQGAKIAPGPPALSLDCGFVTSI